MTRKDRCSYRWKRLERKSTRRRRGGTTDSGLAAERGIGVQRVEAVPVPAQTRDVCMANCNFASFRDVTM